jgi:hypothetical protein
VRSHGVVEAHRALAERLKPRQFSLSYFEKRAAT